MLQQNWLNSVRQRYAGMFGAGKKRRVRRAVSGTIENLEVRQVLTVDSFSKIASSLNGGPALMDVEIFGKSITTLGDLNGDGTDDLAVGSGFSEPGTFVRGAVYILFMNDDGSVLSSTRISSGVNGGPTLADQDSFGQSVEAIGDLDGDGVTDLAVGAVGDGGDLFDGGGAVYILFLNANGTVKSSTKIGDQLNGGPTLGTFDLFGISLAYLGDMNGDTRPELAVGAGDDGTSGNLQGAVYILSLNTNGSAQSFTQIANNVNGGPALDIGDAFGSSVTALGDLDGDGAVDLAVGARGDNSSGPNSSGAVYILFLNTNGTAESITKITSGLNGGPSLVKDDLFGISVTSFGDLDGDGVEDLLVGSSGNDTGGSDRGLVYVLFLNDDGTVKATTRIGNNTGGGPTLANGDLFGGALSPIGDLNSDGKVDLAVGAISDDTGGNLRGAVHILFLDGDFDTSEPNVAPTIAINGGAATYVKNGPGAIVAPNLTLNDANTDPAQQIPGGQLIISIDAVSNKKFTKPFDSLNVLPLESVGTLGNFQLVNNRAQVVVQLNDSATLTQIRDALRGIGFATLKKGLKIPTRTVQFQVIDKAGAASAVVSQTINVRKKAAPM